MAEVCPKKEKKRERGLRRERKERGQRKKREGIVKVHRTNCNENTYGGRVILAYRG